MDFDLSSDQKLLLETAANFVKRESPVGRMRKLRGDAVGWQKATWAQMGELGWLSIAFSEEAGGLGGSFVDAAVVLEQLGTTLVPEPYVPTLLGGTAIARCGSAAQREQWLAPALSGATSLALAWAEEGARFSSTHVRARAEKRGEGWVLQGTKSFVDNGHAADALVISARTAGGDRDRDGLSLFVVPADTPGLKRHAYATIDGRRAATVSLDGVTLGADALLGDAGKAAPVLDELMDLGAAAACAEAVGVMRAVLAMTCEYLRTREQFGVKIGSFQALQHRAVDMFVETELSRSVSMMASMKVSSADANERAAAISAAKAQVAESGRFVTQQAIQLHGGVGITDEHDVGLYFKRMHALGTCFGDQEHHTARFASLPAFA